MKNMRVIILFGLLVFLSEASAKRVPEKLEDQLDLLAEDEALKFEEYSDENEILTEEDNKKSVVVEDPCLKKRCGPGRICIKVDGEASCDCLQECQPEIDERRKICSNHNETWDSDCAVHRMRCLCTGDSPDCSDTKYKHVHIDYYGICKELGECTEDEMVDFPRRMREWLFSVLKDLAQKRDLEKILVQLEKDSKENLSRKWINAVIWKFCDLDSHPHDRSVSRHELFPLRAPLLSMEHCIAPFLDGCDADDDHIISLTEWGKCLGLNENEIEDKCASLRESMNSK